MLDFDKLIRFSCWWQIYNQLFT